MSKPLRHGEYDTKCACGTRFRVQTWKTGKEREQCTTCHVYYKAIYKTMEYMGDKMLEPEYIDAANKLLAGRKK